MEITRKIKAAGGQAFLVGGCVRDALLGQPSEDLDMEVYGLSPEQLETLLSQRLNALFSKCSGYRRQQPS